MKESKSDVNHNPENLSVQIKTDDFSVATGCKEHDVEKQIQNVLMSTKEDNNTPCCSWQGSSIEVNIMEEIKLPALTGESKQPCSNSVADSSSIPEYDHPLHETDKNTVRSKPSVIVSSSSSITEGLFENLESIDQPVSNNTPIAELRNAPEVPPRSRREIPIVTFPDTSMLRLLQARHSLLGPPPSYSKSLLDRRINPCASIQFVAPIPPPSYDGMDNELRYVNYSGFTLGLGNTWQFQSQPAYCPVCETVTITRTDVRISRIAHVSALCLFFLLCWPFCLLPYFLNICNYTFHYCSVCHSYLGARRPFQRNQ